MNVVEAPTDAQTTVIDLPIEARTFVVAGPGSGKTWTLLARAAALTAIDDIGPADLLVLSFTRAVVRELRKRDDNLESPLRIRPETFDAFATRLLAEHSESEEWLSAGFDGRITAAAKLLRNGAAAGSLGRVRHIFLDEVQDLVGGRAELVAALLEAYAGGLTAFGDPAQAIYDHDRPSHERSFVSLLHGNPSVRVYELEGNHRGTPDLAEVASRLRRVILDQPPDAAREAATDALLSERTLGAFTGLAALLDAVQPGWAVLCRDNATALLLSRSLYDEGVAHRVRRGLGDRPVAGWVGALFAAAGALSRSAFGERYLAVQQCSFPALPDEEEAWELLCRLDPQGRRGALRASEVASRIAVGRVPWELYDEPDDLLIVSTIHRAKGLEFDACVIVDWPRREDEDAGLEARVLFVALTRPRRECFQADAPSRHRWYRCAEAGGRFVKRGPRAWQTFGMEVRGDDIHAVDPAGEIAVSEEPAAIQRVLVDDVRPGDAVALLYAGEHDFGTSEYPIYAVQHERLGLPIGVTCEAFGAALHRRLRTRRRPDRITHLRIQDLETVKGSVETGQAAGLGTSGMWLRPRLVGLGELDWGSDA